MNPVLTVTASNRNEAWVLRDALMAWLAGAAAEVAETNPAKVYARAVQAQIEALLISPP